MKGVVLVDYREQQKVDVYIDGEKVSELHPPDWLNFIAYFLHFDSDV